MSDPREIAAQASLLVAPKSLRGESLLITAGGTREPLDPVRAITNRSSGKMGFAIASEAARRGAEVTLVSGPVSLSTPPGVKRVDVETALEMREAVLAALDGTTAFVAAAAVADFRPAERADHKIKKEALACDGESPSLEVRLVPNPDILAEVASRPAEAGRPEFVVGFAAESRDLIEAARRKLERKRCDLIVANDISRSGAGFEADSNAVILVAPDRPEIEVPLAPKSEVAAVLLDYVEAELRVGRS